MSNTPPKTEGAPRPTIRAALDSDAAPLASLISRLSRDEPYLVVSGVDPVTGVSLVSNGVSADEQRFSPEIFVAELDGRLVGIAICRPHPGPERDSIIQLDMGVDAAFRRRGVGTALICHVVGWARKPRVHRIQLAVVAENVAARSLYEKNGFALEGTLRQGFRLEAQFHDVHVMARIVD